MKLQRLFSIQSGGPNQGGSLKRELEAKAKEGALAGGVIGGIFGTISGIQVGMAEGAKTGFKFGAAVTAGSAVLGAIANSLTALGANRRKAKAEKLDMNSLLDYLYNATNFNKAAGYGTLEDVKLERYIVEDKDPNKFMINFSYEDGKLVINLNQPSNKIIHDFDEILEDVVKHNRKADYAASPVDNGFMVFVAAPSIDAAAAIIYNIVEMNKIKVNAITEKSLAKYYK